jgi:type IV pilus assembly protein PilA
METSGALFFCHVAQAARLCKVERSSLSSCRSGTSPSVRSALRMAAELQRTRQMQERINRERGFSLIELLIVVMVILVLAVIAIPNLMRSKIAANEASAIQTVRQIATAEMTYNNTYPTVGYSPDLISLGGPAAGCTPDQTHACILDSAVVTGNKSGYKFFAAGFLGAGVTTNTTFVASSSPLNFNTSGVRMFCIATDDGSARWKLGTAGAPPAPDVPSCITYTLM